LLEKASKMQLKKLGTILLLQKCMQKAFSVTVEDEFCSNDSYSDKPTATTSPGAAAAATAPPHHHLEGLEDLEDLTNTA
jgi:hypothetical protein